MDGPAGKLVISRSPDNGGDVTYETVDALEKDYASGALHPGDLKAALSAVMVQVLESLSNELKSDTASKSVKDLKAYQKKAAKNKKK
jgi:tyrosyl-tRNA synthetase